MTCLTWASYCFKLLKANRPQSHSMRRKYLLVGGSLLLFALAATLLLFGNVNTSEFSTGVATGAVLTGFGLLVWAIQTAVIE